MADTFGYLSDAEVPPDLVADLVATLMRKGVFSQGDGMDLYSAYLSETALTALMHPRSSL